MKKTELIAYQGYAVDLSMTAKYRMWLMYNKQIAPCLVLEVSVTHCTLIVCRENGAHLCHGEYAFRQQSLERTLSIISLIERHQVWRYDYFTMCSIYLDTALQKQTFLPNL